MFSSKMKDSITVKRLYFLSLFIIVLLTLWVQFSAASEPKRFFEINAVDTMKYSRDTSRNKEAIAHIPELVAAAATLHPTHIAIATPYDDEFIPVLKIWVTEIRKRNIKVWFRGNFSSWEGWFDYPKFKDPGEHVAKTQRFIKNNPGLFENGDIFTPAPEPENGGYGDPRRDDATRKKFFDFLPRSYNTCQSAMKDINKDVACGYFSTNGDVARMFTRQDTERLGNVLVIDHYVKTPEQLIQDIKDYHAKTGAKIVLGEFGAPIPDIHGDLSEAEQADLIKRNMIELTKNRDIIGGINYWTAFGGSTEIFSNGLPKKAAGVLETYFNPVSVSGHVENEFGERLSGAEVSNGLMSTKTDIFGNYTLMTTPDFPQLNAKKDGYNSTTTTMYPKEGSTDYQKNIALSATRYDFWYYLKQFFHKIVSFSHF